RILRLYVNLIDAALRTNYFQRDAEGERKPYLSFKLDSHAVKDLPLPRPLFEIFVYSPSMEGIHLRGGKVARGGIRWSDRREDFRFEILGLMKAQMVKNVVIVPVGSKGGFVVKNPSSDRATFQQEGVAAYKTLLRGIGDMSGDVFGNAMLLSPYIQLIGAFNHVHIFVDPRPDPASSLAERRRMFDQRLGWNAYNKELLSPGGAIYERSAKTITVSDEVQHAFDLPSKTLA